MYSVTRLPDLQALPFSSGEVKPPTSWAVAPASKSFFLLCLLQGPVFALHPLLAAETVGKKTRPIIWGFSSGAILTCLNVTAIFLPLQRLIGTTLILAEEVCPTPSLELSAFHFPYFWCYFSPFALFLPFSSVNSVSCFCMWQCLLHPQSKCLSIFWYIGKNASLGIRQICVLMLIFTGSVSLASARRWGYSYLFLRCSGSLISWGEALTVLSLLGRFHHFTHPFI